MISTRRLVWSDGLRRRAQDCSNDTASKSDGPGPHMALLKSVGCPWNFAKQSANTAQSVQFVCTKARSDKFVKFVIVLVRGIFPFANSGSYRSFGLGNDNKQLRGLEH